MAGPCSVTRSIVSEVRLARACGVERSSGSSVERISGVRCVSVSSRDAKASAGSAERLYRSAGHRPGSNGGRAQAIVFLRLPKSVRPSLMASTIEAKLSSSSTMSAASRATSLAPSEPIATPG
eukprot:scaffold22583_cov60-Phaeocystis_antarctica.AAC.4